MLHIRNQKNKTQINALLSMVLILLIAPSSSVFAAKAKFLMTPLTDTQVTVSTDKTVTISYKVTNQTLVTRTLAVRAIQGLQQITTSSGACANPFTLTPGASCTLVLRSAGSAFATTVDGDPVVCKTKSSDDNALDPFLCSQPQPGSRILIIRTTPADQLQINPSSLTLEVTTSAASGTMAVTNISTKTIHNIRADFSNTLLDGYVSQDASQCTDLAPDSSCSLVFTATGNTAVSTTAFPIQGDNAKPVGAEITLNNPGAPEFSVTPSSLVVDAGSTGTLTITNTSSSVTANNITATSQVLTNAGVTFSGCSGALTTGSSCTLTVNAQNVQIRIVPTDMTLTAENNNASASFVTDALVAITGSSPLSVSGSPLTLYADGSTTGTMTITNIGNVAVENVTAYFGSALRNNVTATTCDSITPGGQCIMTFTPGVNPVSSSTFVIASRLTQEAVQANLTINPVPYAFFSSQNAAEIVSCQLNPLTGALATGACTDALVDTTDTIISNPAWGLAVDPSNQYLYIANTSSVQSGSGAAVFGITKCEVNNQSILTHCEVLPVSGATTGFQSVFINSTATYAYLGAVAQAGATTLPVYKCSIASDGSFSSCESTGVAGWNVVSNPNYPEAYILNGDGGGGSTITSCQINTSTGLFTSCSSPTTANVDFLSYGLAISPINNTLYYSDFISSDYTFTLNYCQTSSGVITSCTPSSALIERSLGLAINTAGTLLYSASGNGNYSSYCSISPTNGSIESCLPLFNNIASAANKLGVALLNF